MDVVESSSGPILDSAGAVEDEEVECADERVADNKVEQARDDGVDDDDDDEKEVVGGDS
jgi:hypothetical protein